MKRERERERKREETRARFSSTRARDNNDNNLNKTRRLFAVFIMRLDLKTYLIFKFSRDDERKVHHHHFHHRTFSSPNNSYTQLLIFPFEKRRESGDTAKRKYHITRGSIRPLKLSKKFKTEAQTRFASFYTNLKTREQSVNTHSLSLFLFSFRNK